MFYFTNHERSRFHAFTNDFFHFHAFTNEKKPIPGFTNGKNFHFIFPHFFLPILISNNLMELLMKKYGQF